MIKLYSLIDLHDTLSYRTFDWNDGLEEYPSIFAYQILLAISSTGMSEVDSTVTEGRFL